MTLVEDATHVSEGAAVDITGIPSAVASVLGFGNGQLSVAAECGINGGSAICTDVAVLGSETILVHTATVGPTAIPVVSAAASDLRVAAFMGLVTMGAILTMLL